MKNFKKVILALIYNLALFFTIYFIAKLFIFTKPEPTIIELTSNRIDLISNNLDHFLLENKIKHTQIIGNSPEGQVYSVLNHTGLKNVQKKYSRDVESVLSTLENPAIANKNTFYWANLVEDSWKLKTEICSFHKLISIFNDGNYNYLCSSITEKLTDTEIKIIYKSGSLIFYYKE